MGLVRSVKVVAVPGGVSAPLSAEGGAGSEVPSALSTPPFSCRKRFLLNLALAFWNQTCKPIPMDFFTDACLALLIFVFVLAFFKIHLWCLILCGTSPKSCYCFSCYWWYWLSVYRPSATGAYSSQRAALRKICSLTYPKKATLDGHRVFLGLGSFGVETHKDWGKGWVSRFLPRLKACLD